MVYLIWIISAIYCLYKLYKRSIRTSLDGVIGYSPGLEILMVLMLAPLLAIVDVVVGWYKSFHTKENTDIDIDLSDESIH